MSKKSKERKALLKVPQMKLNYKHTSGNNFLKVEDAETAYVILKSCWDVKHMDAIPETKALLLDENRACLGVAEVSTSFFDPGFIDVQAIFTTALLANAKYIFLAHNVAGGHLLPTQNDIEYTTDLIKAGEVMRIFIDDHLIISNKGFRSMANENDVPLPPSKGAIHEVLII